MFHLKTLTYASTRKCLKLHHAHFLDKPLELSSNIVMGDQIRCRLDWRKALVPRYCPTRFDLIRTKVMQRLSKVTPLYLMYMCTYITSYITYVNA